MKILLSLLFALLFTTANAEDGHLLWLRAKPNAHPANVGINLICNNKTEAKSPAINIAKEELQTYWHRTDSVMLRLDHSISPEREGYVIYKLRNTVTVASPTAIGLLYGAYALLRCQELNTMTEDRDVMSEVPTTPIRILNHWDNPNGTVERGFAGRSIFWSTNGEADANMIKEYARANASIGINATVLNNVNAKPDMLSKAKLRETKRIADILRPYGIKVWLSVNFASPKALGGLSTADPLNAEVRKWWKDKAAEIYRLIPDFGGFLVKANSEGEPGPMDYGRTHVDGANMLAEALHPHGGMVMWRAFVYAPSSPDRANQAYDEFVPFDGQFAHNVIIQIKNGPVDFQPREPVSPLFFGLKKTEMMPEFQITQEYLGESIHAVFLANMWREFFETVDCSGQKALSGVANIGTDRNWCGSDMAQANWYAFGRMAWNRYISPEQIAKEWLTLTFTSDKNFVEPMQQNMLASHEACVNYMMPLGLHHIFAGGHHYGPEPWCAPQGWREDWLPRYYHRADGEGIGFDRTKATGTGNTAQYSSTLAAQYEDIAKCPENLILWFHHVPWSYRMKSGETLWETLCHTYDRGVREAASLAQTWQGMAPYVDAERYADIKKRYERQAADAWWWRDACLLYFQTFSKLPLPQDCPAPRHNLEDLMRYKLNMDNYTAADMDKLP